MACFDPGSAGGSAEASAATVQLSEHARRRMQQRGIRLRDVEQLLELGRVKRQDNGMLVYLDREGRRRLTERTERLSRLYLVLSPDGETVVTVAHRTRNLRLH